MRRLALVTLLTMLALPGAALARARGPVTFPARVVRSGSHSLTVRLADGAIVHYASPRVATPGSARPLLAHAARAAGYGMTLDLRGLEPGVTVLVRESARGVTISLPGPGAPERQASGVVTDIQPDAFVLRLADHTELRLHAAHAAGLRRCMGTRVKYHQDAGLLVADAVQRAGARLAQGCVRQSAAGTITRLSTSALTISGGDGRSMTFLGTPSITDGFVVGDVVDVSYVRGRDGKPRARQVAYVQTLARGVVTGSSNGVLTIADSATGRPVRLMTSATPAPGAHVVVVYHQSAGGAVAGVVYAQAG